MTQLKMQSLIEFLNGGGSLNSTTVRFDIYALSVNSFIEYPIYGVGGYYKDCETVIGCHSQIIDDLARYGLIGVVPLYAFIFLFFKRILKEMQSNSIRNVIILTLLLFFILALVNPVFLYGISYSMFYILPLYSKYLYLNVNK